MFHLTVAGKLFMRTSILLTNKSLKSEFKYIWKLTCALDDLYSIQSAGTTLRILLLIAVLLLDLGVNFSICGLNNVLYWFEHSYDIIFESNQLWIEYNLKN